MKNFFSITLGAERPLTADNDVWVHERDMPKFLKTLGFEPKGHLTLVKDDHIEPADLYLDDQPEKSNR